MENRVQSIVSRENKSVKIGVIPGHFATNHSHVNYYIDMTAIKSQHKMAESGAAVLAEHYRTVTPVDTIICLEGTEMLGAFLARELSQSGPSMSAGRDICVITPELNANNQMIFRDNTQKMIWNQNILLLISSASSREPMSGPRLSPVDRSVPIHKNTTWRRPDARISFIKRSRSLAANFSASNPASVS